MGSHDRHLPKRPLDKAANPKDIKRVKLADQQRAARVVGLRRKKEARKARRGDELERGERLRAAAARR